MPSPQLQPLSGHSGANAPGAVSVQDLQGRTRLQTKYSSIAPALGSPSRYAAPLMHMDSPNSGKYAPGTPTTPSTGGFSTSGLELRHYSMASMATTPPADGRKWIPSRCHAESPTSAAERGVKPSADSAEQLVERFADILRSPNPSVKRSTSGSESFGSWKYSSFNDSFLKDRDSGSFHHGGAEPMMRTVAE